MNVNSPVLQEMNAIAYNGNLRNQLKILHEMLGTEVTDVASSAMEFGYKFKGNSEKVLKFLSQMASQLSIALIEARQTKKKLSPEEKKDYEDIKSLTEVLGNMQDKLNRIAKFTGEVNLMNNNIREHGLDLASYIVDTQEQFRNVRSNINAYGFLSKNPKLSYLLDEQNSEQKNSHS